MTDAPVVTPTRPKPKTRDQTRLLPPYHVIIMNDDDHSFEFVVHVLTEVFRMKVEQAFTVTREAHERGRAIVWTGSKEVAEHKYEMLQSVHEKHWQSGRDLGPVRCRIEAAR